MNIGSLIQTGDWKGEKHVPIIHCKDTVKADEVVEIKVSIGDEIPHPNTMEHYISWVQVFFHPEGSKFPIEIGKFEFKAHGESDLFSQPFGVCQTKINKSGTIHAISYCNIHGLWENKKSIIVE